MDDTGQYQSFAIIGGYIYISVDFGNNWIPTGLQKDWYSIDMNSSGKYITGVVLGGQIYKSQNIFSFSTSDPTFTGTTTTDNLVTEGTVQLQNLGTKTDETNLLYIDASGNVTNGAFITYSIQLGDGTNSCPNTYTITNQSINPNSKILITIHEYDISTNSLNAFALNIFSEVTKTNGSCTVLFKYYEISMDTNNLNVTLKDQFDDGSIIKFDFLYIQ